MQPGQQVAGVADVPARTAGSAAVKSLRTPVPLIARLSDPELPMTDPFGSKSAWFTVKIVPVLRPARRISTLVNVVLVRSRVAAAIDSVSLPILPMTDPPADKSA